MIGRVIDHFQIKERIGHGTYGDVYLAVNLRLLSPVAIKILRPALLRDVLLRRELRREARLLAKLHHPNVVQILDYIEDSDLDAVIMEFVEGEPLDHALARGPLEEKTLLHHALQVCDGLQAAHDKGVIHRDIKPSNIRVNAQGWVKLLDFGLAKLIAQSQSVTTDQAEAVESGIAGTMPYIAPEIWRNSGVTAASDLYSVGVVLYEMATGARPFPGLVGQPLIQAILYQEAPRVREANPAISPELDEVIAKLLAKRPEDRFGSARELHAALDAIHARYASRSGSGTLRSSASTWGARSGAGRSRWAWVAGAVAAATAAVTIPLAFAPHRPISVLAAVPFDAADSSSVYYADGVTEDITRLLSESGRPEVIAWASMRRYRGSPMSLKAISREVGADALVVGSLRSDAGGLQLSVELVDGRKGHVLRSWKRTGPLDAVPALESDVVGDLFRLLRPDSKPGGARARALPADPVALELLFRGRSLMSRRGRDDILEARSCFERSLARDTTNSQAWSALAEARCAMAFSGFEEPRTAFPDARRAARRALELDPSSADAHASLGNILQNHDRDWDGAEAEFRKALELNPNHATAHHWLASNLALRGRFAEADREIAQARSLDPNSLPVAVAPAAHLYFARRYPEALRALEAASRLDSSSWLVLRMRATVLDRLGRDQESMAALERWLDGTGLHAVAEGMARAYAAGGYPAALRLLIGALERQRAAGAYAPATHIAELYSRLGEREAAIRWLLVAEGEIDTELNRLQVDPLFDPLRGDPRFEALVRRVGLGAGSAPVAAARHAG